MEFAFYLLITLACTLAIFFGSANAERKPGTRQRGPFAYPEDDAPTPPAGKAGAKGSPVAPPPGRWPR